MVLEAFYSTVIVAASLLIPHFLLEGEDRRYKGTLTKLILYHYLFSTLFYFFTRNGGGDAWTYWMNSRHISYEDFIEYLKEPGTRFMEAFNYIPANVLGMGFFSNTMLYASMGVLGIAFFFVVILRTVPYNSYIRQIKLFPLLLYFPSLHFWSSGIGKDTLLFMCIGMFAYALLKPGNRMLLLVISLMLAFAVRPHVMLMMSAGVGFTYLFSSQMSLTKRMFFLAVLAGVSLYFLPKVMEYVKLDDLSLDAIENKGRAQAELLQGGAGSAVDINAYPLPLKMFTFLFRPLFFDAHNVTSLMASIENVLLLFLSYKTVVRHPIRTYTNAPFVVCGLLIMLLIATFLFSQTLGNLGVMIRMRNMFLPGLLIYILWALSFQQTYRLKK